MHRITDTRISGSARKNLKVFLELCGDLALKNVVIVTNMWGKVTLGVGKAREEELRNSEVFRPLLERGAQMVGHDGSPKSAEEIIKMFLDNTPRGLRIQREIVNHGKDIFETQAAHVLDRQLAEMTKMVTAIREEGTKNRRVKEPESGERQMDAERSRRAQQEVKWRPEKPERQRSAGEIERPRHALRKPRRSHTTDALAEASTSPTPVEESSRRKSEGHVQQDMHSPGHFIHSLLRLTPFRQRPSSPSNSGKTKEEMRGR